MGATIALLAGQGHDVLLVDVTDGEPTPLGDHETRRGEAQAALEVLREGASGRVERVCLGLPNRYVSHTVENRHKVAGVIRAWQAQVLFSPALPDAHPDHVAVAHLVRDARFDAKLTKVEMPGPVCAWTGQRWEVGPPVYAKWSFGYFCTHLRTVPSPSFIVGVGEAELGKKMAAVRAYATQFVASEKNRPVVEWVEHAARYLGSRVGAPAGEAFESVEPLGLGSLEGLLV